MSALDRVYQYRLLLGKSASGAGLSFDEIEALTALEAAFAETAAPSVDGRRFRREAVTLPALVRGGKLNDAVTVADIGPGGMVCGAAPYAEVGDAVEIVIDDVELALTYRFKARVQWRREDGDDYAARLRVDRHAGAPPPRQLAGRGSGAVEARGVTC
jgi:hypothetical protein